MTNDDRKQILKDCLVTKVQNDPDWARPIEVAIERELSVVLLEWLQAGQEEHIGTRELFLYLSSLTAAIRKPTMIVEKVED